MSKSDPCSTPSTACVNSKLCRRELSSRRSSSSATSPPANPLFWSPSPESASPAARAYARGCRSSCACRTILPSAPRCSIWSTETKELKALKMTSL
ncbi:hypothetical protein KSP39_PZI020553 [Platanthera zijinensis]|uniref:Uncharacterized protein n=1 Tax=Platanthera zijinensis TaxID=2320716 RepID=A0AAP0AZN5_9ASPA